MISVPLKRTDEVDWVTPLKRYIAVSYQDDPEKYAEEAGTIHRLRQDMRGAGNDSTGRDVLYRYFGQLELLDLRFPVDEAHIKIGFMWYVRKTKQSRVVRVVMRTGLGACSLCPFEFVGFE